MNRDVCTIALRRRHPSFHCPDFVSGTPLPESDGSPVPGLTAPLASEFYRKGLIELGLRSVEFRAPQP